MIFLKKIKNDNKTYNELLKNLFSSNETATNFKGIIKK